MPAIGEMQKNCLDCMTKNGRDGRWFNGCGWYWNSRSGTIKIMESLLKRGLVTKTRHPDLSCDVYTITTKDAS